MCGIAGSVNKAFDPNRVNAVMGHRGPDAQQTFTAENVQLHHLRLAILDKAGGGQPMHYLGRYTIVFNGEIYNHLEVRKTLALQCHTQSDTETLLLAYHQQGSAMLPLLDGMFAFAIFDQQTHTLFAARDRAGKKPFYYYQHQEQFVFASELNALRSLLPLHIETRHLYGYLRLGSMYRQQTPYVHVQELLPGHTLLLNTKTMACSMQPWWQIGHQYLQPPLVISEADAVAELDLRLKTLIRRRIDSSDLEVGSFLSGGIDSGLITAMAAGMHPTLQTFTVSFEDTFDEAPLAKMVADKYQTRHHEINIDFTELPQVVEGIVQQYGEPFYDSSCIPSWYVSRAASQHLTVILNGDGADELFGGYRRYVPFQSYDFFNTPKALQLGAGAISKWLPPGHQKGSKYLFFQRLLSLIGSSGAARYLTATSDIFEGYTHALLADENMYFNAIEADFLRVANAAVSGLRKMLWLDFDITMASDFLVKMDIATMAHSLEGRSPMLGKELLEWVPQLPDDLKIRGKQTKYLLKKLAANYLPAPLLSQPKRGFEVPLKKWVNHQLKPLIFDYLQSSNALYPQLTDQKFVAHLLEGKHRMSEEKRAKILWTLTAMEIWYKHQANL